MQEIYIYTETYSKPYYDTERKSFEAEARVNII